MYWRGGSGTGGRLRGACNGDAAPERRVSPSERVERYGGSGGVHQGSAWRGPAATHTTARRPGKGAVCHRSTWQGGKGAERVGMDMRGLARRQRWGWVCGGVVGMSAERPQRCGPVGCGLAGHGSYRQQREGTSWRGNVRTGSARLQRNGSASPGGEGNGNARQQWNGAAAVRPGLYRGGAA